MRKPTNIEAKSKSDRKPRYQKTKTTNSANKIKKRIYEEIETQLRKQP